MDRFLLLSLHNTSQAFTRKVGFGKPFFDFASVCLFGPAMERTTTETLREGKIAELH